MLIKTKSTSFVILLCSIALVTVVLAFKVQQDGQIERISPSCLNPSGETWLKKIIGDPKKCTDADRQNVAKFIQLKRENTQYKIYEGNTFKSTSKWYNDEFFNWNNRWLGWLAIIAPESEVIYTDEAAGIIVFSDMIKGNFSSWVWRLNGVNRPNEMKLIDLQAGDEADRDFITYLKKNNGENFKKSRLLELIKKWKDSNYTNSYEVIAFLPEGCNKSSSMSNEDNCLDYAKDAAGQFEPKDVNKDQPMCISNFLNGNGSSLFGMLVKNMAFFQVWTSVKYSIPIDLPFYPALQASSPRNKYLPWLAIQCFSDCQQIKSFETNGKLFIVLGCGKYLLTFGPNGETFYPLALLNKHWQQQWVDWFKRQPNEYPSSNLHDLVKQWSNSPSDPRSKNVVLAIGNTNGYDSRSDTSDLAPYLTKSAKPERGGSLTFLTYNLGMKKYRLYSSGSFEVKDSWYKQIASAGNPDTPENIWLAQLATVDDGVKLLGNSTYKSFIVSKPNPYLWSWKLKVDGSEPEEYAPLENLYDKGNNYISIAYSKAITNHTDFFDYYLKENIKKYFNGNIEKIAQIYPQNISEKGDSPYGIMGENDLSNTDTTIPQTLKSAFTNGNPLSYIIEKNNGLFVENGTTTREVKGSEKVSHFKDPWVAWLCIANPSIKLIATARDGNPTRLCMTLSPDFNTLWSWDANPNAKHPPIQKKLIEKESKFELTGKPIKDYLANLPLSDEEEAFFLAKADQNDNTAFLLSDLFEYTTDGSSRVLLWRVNNSSERRLFRVGKAVDQEEAIHFHQIDLNQEQTFSWVEISNRYKQGWFRNSFEEHLGRTKVAGLDAWFGKQRLGISLGNQIGVFLSPPYRNFGFKDLGNINKLVDDIVYIPMERWATIPGKNVFFYSWVEEKWDRETWRANPLGYFDRLR